MKKIALVVDYTNNAEEISRINDSFKSDGYQTQFLTTGPTQTDNSSSLNGGQPTKENILNTMRTMISQADSGDSMIFYFCGYLIDHPTNNNANDTEDDYHTFVPLDALTLSYSLVQSKLITKEEFKSILKLVPEGVKALLIFDPTFSGSALEFSSALSEGTINNHMLAMLLIEADAGNLDNVAYILSLNKIEWNSNNLNRINTELELSVKQDNLKKVEALLKVPGVDVNQANNQVPLVFSAVNNENASILLLLLNHNAIPDVECQVKLITPLHFIMTLIQKSMSDPSRKDKLLKIAGILIDYGANIHYYSLLGFKPTPFNIARDCDTKNYSVMDFMINKHEEHLRSFENYRLIGHDHFRQNNTQTEMQNLFSFNSKHPDFESVRNFALIQSRNPGYVKAFLEGYRMASFKAFHSHQGQNLVKDLTGNDNDTISFYHEDTFSSSIETLMNQSNDLIPQVVLSKALSALSEGFTIAYERYKEEKPAKPDNTQQSTAIQSFKLEY